MTVLQVLSPGLLTTAQDLGRPGYGPSGVSPSGAADELALRLGNRLVGNADGAAALEMTLLGGTFLFPQGSVIALAGAPFASTLDDLPLPPWTAQLVRPGQRLRVGAGAIGARCYLCVRGGFDVPQWLGSVSTHLLSGLGGWEGRALRKGDELPLGESSGPFVQRTVTVRVLSRLSQGGPLRVTPGLQQDWFSEAARASFYGGMYQVSVDSNRLGLRLTGRPLVMDTGRQMISEGVALGAVQVSPDGLPMILFVEQQTAGGYPKIANVVSADLWRLGQLRPRQTVQFADVDFATARRLWREQQEWLAGAGLIEE